MNTYTFREWLHERPTGRLHHFAGRSPTDAVIAAWKQCRRSNPMASVPYPANPTVVLPRGVRGGLAWVLEEQVDA